ARLYEPLFTVRDPDGAEGDLLDYVNPTALREVRGLIEPSVAQDDPDTRYQFERQGYFWRDPVDGRGPLDVGGKGAPAAPLVFNRIVGLKDAWARRSAPESSTTNDRARTGAASERAELPERNEPRAHDERASQAASVEQLTPDQRARYHELTTEHGLPENDALMLATRAALDDLYTAAVAEGAGSTSAANWVLNDLAGHVGQEG